jgi:hypothetical protein
MYFDFDFVFWKFDYKVNSTILVELEVYLI